MISKQKCKPSWFCVFFDKNYISLGVGMFGTWVNEQDNDISQTKSANDELQL